MRFKVASLTLGHISGIKIVLHWSFVALLPFLGVQALLYDISALALLIPLIIIVLVFTCVLLHELGHTFAARYYGIETENITLMPIGGVARLKSQPEEPFQEFVVAIAGPMVNLAIMALILPYLVYAQVAPLSLMHIGAELNIVTIIFQLNMFLFLFNMLPAFPMDGGRILRSLLAMRISRFRATNFAAILGMIFGVGIMAYGLFDNLWLLFVGAFIVFNAFAEFRNNRMMEELAEYKAGELADTSFVVYNGSANDRDFAEYVANTPVRYILITNAEDQVPFKGSTSSDPPLIAQYLVYSKAGQRTAAADGGIYSQKDSQMDAMNILPALDSSADIRLDKLFRSMSLHQTPYAVLSAESNVFGVLDLDAQPRHSTAIR